MEQNEGKSRQEQRQERKEKRAKEPLKRRVLFGCAYALIAIMMGAGLYLVAKQYVIFPGEAYQTPPPLTTAVPTPSPAAVVEETAAPTPEPTPYVQRLPVAVYFPKPEYKSVVYAVGLAEDNSIGTVDSATDCAWFDQSAAPGEPGNCIISGHVTWKGNKGVFQYLKDIAYEEEVIVELDDGSYVYYSVYSIETYPYNEFPAHVLSLDTSMDRLTLVTCLGDYDRTIGTSQTRVVVVCKPTGTVPAP